MQHATRMEVAARFFCSGGAVEEEEVEWSWFILPTVGGCLFPAEGEQGVLSFASSVRDGASVGTPLQPGKCVCCGLGAAAEPLHRVYAWLRYSVIQKMVVSH